uniref:Uncharacterized protein AlNc14C264G9856 n=1 Tax=Albugo laibachii Nc14 TaxID=890382 RepID=F0WU33_9STRA|nr:conserved hypothetical protein [Albugo laibachii Nc14]|eukprot:CCA24878.1 conserved hypothetical protein [Albugo laibachii Nc14]
MNALQQEGTQNQDVIVITRVPKFLRSLYGILAYENESILSWSADGTYFQIFQTKRLEREILPKYFKHCKFASFQRQLNNFGFRKWTKTQSNVCTFSHQFYVRQHPDCLVDLIVRNNELVADKRYTVSSNTSKARCISGLRPVHKSVSKIRRQFRDKMDRSMVVRKKACCSLSLSTELRTSGERYSMQLEPEHVQLEYGEERHQAMQMEKRSAEFIDMYPPEMLNDILQSAAEFIGNTAHETQFSSNEPVQVEPNHSVMNHFRISTIV